MYLTRMRLNESNPNTAKALASPHIFHGTVERCFGGERKRNLWRIDHLNHQLYLMLLSPDKPDLSAAVTYEGVLTVTDTELFCKALTEGIGRGKAYGMGLLTVARVASNEK